MPRDPAQTPGVRRRATNRVEVVTPLPDRVALDLVDDAEKHGVTPGQRLGELARRHYLEGDQ